MKRGGIRTILAAAAAVSILGGCAVPKGAGGDAADGGSMAQEQPARGGADQALAMARPMLIAETVQREEELPRPCVEAYEVDPEEMVEFEKTFLYKEPVQLPPVELLTDQLLQLHS